MEQPKQPKTSWFDRELAWLIGVFALLWVVIGGGGFYALPVVMCLNSEAQTSLQVCSRALERSRLPQSLLTKVRTKLIDAQIGAYDYDKALVLIEAEEKVAGATVLLLEKKATTLRSLGRAEDAALAYRQAMKLEPSNELMADTLISLELDNQNFDGAREFAADFVTRHPKAVSIIAWQGWIEHRAGDNALALSIYDRAIAMEPHNSTLHRDVANIKIAMGRPTEALDSIGTAISASPDNHYYLNKRAEIYESIGDLASSQADYEKSLALERSTTTLVTLGRSYTDSGHYEKALPLLNEAVAEDYEWEWAYSSKIRLHVFEDKLPVAKSTLEELLKKLPESVDGKFWNATIAAREGRNEEAIREYKAFLADYPYYSDAMLELGQTLIDVNRPAESIPYFTQAIASWPNSEVAYTARARGNFAIENYIAALSDANQSIKLKPKQGRAYGYRALALVKLARTKEARESFDTAIANDPKLEWVQRDYFDFLIAENDLDAAKAVLDNLRVTFPNSKYIAEFETKLAAEGIKLP